MSYTKQSFLTLQKNVVVTLMDRYDEVTATKEFDYYIDRKVMRLIVQADFMTKLNLIVCLDYRDNVLEWCYDREMNASDAMQYNDLLKEQATGYQL